MSSSQESKGNTNQIQEPSLRMKQLVGLSHNISVERNVPISRYFNSGREIIKAASALENSGDIEKAFVLYLRYMTLFVEKLVHHPEYNKVGREEKTLVKNECNNVFERAENLKKQILEKYSKEYEQSRSNSTGPATTSDTIQKRSIEPYGGSKPDCDFDDIDKKFNFSMTPSDGEGPI